MRAILNTTAVFALTLAACAVQDRAPAPGATAEAKPPPGSPKQATGTDIVPLTQKKFGQAITENSTTPLPSIANDPTKYQDKMVRTEGTVSAVCQAMGCWMQIADTSGRAHIKMAGHSFFVPKQSSGHRAIVQGKVTGGANQPNACAGNDGCGNQEVTQVQIEATGVEFLD